MCKEDQSSESEIKDRYEEEMEQMLKLKDPKMMDLKLVHEMFNDIKKDWRNIKQDNEKKQTSINSVETAQTQQATEIQEINSRYDKQQKKTEVLESVVIGMANKIKTMEERVIDLERKSIKNCVVLSGFYASDNKRVGMNQVEEFFESEMGVNVAIEDLYYIEESQPRSIVLTFQTLQDKTIVMENKKKRKDIENKDGKQYYINDLLQAETSERRRKERAIYNRDKNTVAHKVEMSFFKGGLQIQNEQYKPKVKEPQIQDVLVMTSEEVDAILALKIAMGEKVHFQGDTFVGFSKPVNDYVSGN